MPNYSNLYVLHLTQAAQHLHVAMSWPEKHVHAFHELLINIAASFKGLLPYVHTYTVDERERKRERERERDKSRQYFIVPFYLKLKWGA